MSLTTFLEKRNLKQADVARTANIPKSSLSNHLKFEATNGAQGKPLGVELSMRAVKAYEGLSLDDLRPDWVDKLDGFNG